MKIHWNSLKDPVPASFGDYLVLVDDGRGRMVGLARWEGAWRGLLEGLCVVRWARFPAWEEIEVDEKRFETICGVRAYAT